MTTTAAENVTSPDLDSPRGYYGNATSTHVKNLLARSTYASSTKLTPSLIERMRRHYQVSQGLIVQSLPLIRADWSIECEDDDIRERLTEAYRLIAFHVHRAMCKALHAGYSPSTLTWSYRDDLKGIYPTEIRDLEPSSCRPLVDEWGTFDGFTQTINGNADEIDPIYALWIVEGMESGNYYGRSILDAALDPYSDHAAFRAFHARGLERFGEPVVIARAPAGKTIANQAAIAAAVALGEEPPAPILEDNLDTALSMGENLRHHSVVALPSSLLFGADGKPTGYAWNLEFLESKGSGSEAVLLGMQECDKRISRAMFLPDLLVNNTEDVGSNALGQTHKGVWQDATEGRLDDYSRQITEQILDPARILNFGPDSPEARLVFAPLSDEELERNWGLVVTLVEGGQIPVDARELAAKYDLPLLDEDAPPAAPPPAAPVDGDLRRELDAARPAVRFASEDPVAGLPDWKIPQAFDPPPFRRELNAREARVGFARLEDALNGNEAATIRALVDVLDLEHERVLKQLTGIMKKGTAAEILTALGTIEIKGGPTVVRAWSDLMAEISTIAVENLRTELAAYADQIRDLGPEGRALFKSYATASSDRVLSGLLTEVRLELLNAYTSGVSRAGMAAVVGTVFDAYSSSEGKAVRLTTRMLSAKSLNYSRAAAVERGGIPLAGAQYSAILDRRTCELCEDLDERVIPITHTDLARFTPPVHHNCRCLWVWITTDEEDFTPTWSTPAASKVDRFGGLVF